MEPRGGGLMYQSRLTIDIDGYVPQWRLQAIRAWYELNRIADRVDVHVSSSGTGLHIIAFFEDPEDGYIHRERLSDDYRRVELDRERRKYGLLDNVSWQRKSANDGEKIRDFTDIWDALDYITEQIPPEDRLKFAIQRGLVI